MRSISRRRPLSRILIVAVTTMMVVACGGSTSTNTAASGAGSVCSTPGSCEPPADILAKAKAEGSVVIYSALGTALSGPLGQAFEAKYGIKLVATETTQADSLVRVENEADAGKRVADMVPLGDPAVYDLWLKTGVITTFTKAQVPNSAVLNKTELLESSAFLYGGAVYTLGYNTAKSPGGVAPTGYCELTDPKWKGLVGLTFQPGATTFAHFAMIEKACGPNYFPQLVANGVKFYASTSNATQSLAAGEIGALISTVPYILAPFKAQGAPVNFALPPQGITVSTRWGAIVKNAPHPNAALVFANFLLSVDAQKLMYTGGFLGYSVLPQSVMPDSLHTTVPITFAYLSNAKAVEPRITKELGKA